MRLLRRPAPGAPVPAEPLVAPRASIDGWTLAGTALDATALAGRLSRDQQRELSTLLHGVDVALDTPYTDRKSVV